MRKALLDLMACPQCQGDLQLHAFTSDHEHVAIDGCLICTGCQSHFLIVNAIPRMLPPQLYQNNTFIRKYQSQLSHILPSHSALHTVEDSLRRHKQKTSNSFGEEWELFNRFGWDDEFWDEKKDHKRFYDNTYFDEDDLANQLTLDAGCGNGRYVIQALKRNAQVVSIDLSKAIDVAQANIPSSPHAHFVQGDLFNLPFKPDVFDVAYSIGVLMHTGNSEAAFKSIASKVKRDGLIGISVYQKQNPLHEFNDWWLRKITIKLPTPILYYSTWVMSKVAQLAWKIRLLSIINAFFRLEPWHLCVYDWYKAPVAHHHSLPEVRKWFNHIGSIDIRDGETENCDTRGPIRKWIWPRCGFTVRAKLHSQHP